MTPFRFSQRLFRWFCDPKLHPSIEGDLLELFEEQAKTKGQQKAKWQFLWEVVKLFRPGIIKSFTGNQRLNQLGMIKNYFKIGWRNVMNQKQFSGINIIGLTIGISACLLILCYVYNELSYDKYHSNLDNMYRVLHFYGDSETPAAEDYQVWGSAPAGPAMLGEFPEVKSFCRFTSPSILLLENEQKKFQEDNLLFADSSTFQLFSWRLLVGNPMTALVEPNSIVLTQSMAVKYFGTVDIIGETLVADHEEPLKITGVMEDVPPQSQMTFDGLISMTSFYNWRPGIFSNWGYVDFYTYLLLNENASIASLRAKNNLIYEKMSEIEKHLLDYEPMKGAYLHSVAARQPGDIGSISNVYMLSFIGLFILIIACVNFINLATARSVERAKEVGVRKTLGALRHDLTFQFLTESMLIAIFSSLLAVGIVALIVPYFHYLVGKPIAFEGLLTTQYVTIYAGITLLIGLLAGLYPAWVLSGFSPSQVLKGKFKSTRSGTQLRRSLVVFQFCLAIILVIATTVVYHQLKYMQNKDMGFTQDQMVVVDFGWDNVVQDRINLLKHEYLSHPDVVSVSASRAVPGDFFPNAGTGIENPFGEIKYHAPAIFEIDADFVPNFDIKMAAGRSFSRDFVNDSIESLMINEAALSLYGYNSAKEIIGKKFSQWGRKGKIIGVVKDFNYKSLHAKVEPLSLRFGQNRDLRRIAIRVNSNRMQETIAELQLIWDNLVPQRPFNFVFLDQSFNQHYKSDVRFGRLFGVFALIAIFIACLGLFGLTVYATEQRAKEIGIRKVLGASIPRIMSLISKEFLALVLVAAIVAIPISWYGMHLWLEGFAHRVTLTLAMFAISVLSVGMIAISTIGWQIFATARRNPVDVIKDE
ncbi:ABC transporter permease [Reichenbachiella sp.]|uniref:ABC transporter permease n=1 Tax=Reichenbachiella sp. TaxID=2184521 RepID=UPI003B5BEA69